MKLISYIALAFGIILLISAIIFNFTGIIGYILTLSAVASILIAILSNKPIRELFISIFINLF